MSASLSNTSASPSALEALAGYRRFRHGEAVSVGMVAAARLAHGVGMLAESDSLRVEGLLAALGLPIRLPQLPAGDLVATMGSDKKALGGVPRFILPRTIGEAQIVSQVSEDLLRRLLVSLGAWERWKENHAVRSAHPHLPQRW